MEMLMATTTPEAQWVVVERIERDSAYTGYYTGSARYLVTGALTVDGGVLIVTDPDEGIVKLWGIGAWSSVSRHEPETETTEVTV